MRTFTDVVELDEAVGQELGASEWVRITQPMIDAFGEITGSDDWIHTDPARAEASSFGAPIAQGDLIVSLLPRMLLQLYRVQGPYVAMAYGSDRIRFSRTVPVDANVRARASVSSVVRKASGARVTLAVTVEIEGTDQPAVFAEIVHLYSPE